MTDEQKRALEVLENVCTDDCVNKAFVVEPIKQLIQTQQEEIEKLKSVEKKGDITANCNVELIEELRGEIKKKDRVIDLTIRELYKKAHISTKCYLQTSIEECLEHKNCIECLKQYFERKVQNDN